MAARCISGTLQAKREQTGGSRKMRAEEEKQGVSMRSSCVFCIQRKREAVSPAERGGLWSGFTLSGQEERGTPDLLLPHRTEDSYWASKRLGEASTWISIYICSKFSEPNTVRLIIYYTTGKHIERERDILKLVPIETIILQGALPLGSHLGERPYYWIRE